MHSIELTFNPGDPFVPAFQLSKEVVEESGIMQSGVKNPGPATSWRGSARKTVGVVHLHKGLTRLLPEDGALFEMVQPKFLPMVIPPRPWRQWDSGGYLTSRASVMRTVTQLQTDALRENMYGYNDVLDALSILGRTAWCVNKRVLAVMEEIWNTGGGLGEIPRRDAIEPTPVPTAAELGSALGGAPAGASLSSMLMASHAPSASSAPQPPPHAAGSAPAAPGRPAVPDMFAAAAGRSIQESALAIKAAALGPPPPSGAPGSPEEQLRKKYWRDYYRIKRLNTDLHSMRSDFALKLQVAREFRDQRFYFPHNTDFRGRAYPIPPHLNHVGSDISRGMLMFADARPLGPNGLRWLKIHLANLCGVDKVSFDDRVTFVNDTMPRVLAAADKPLGDGPNSPNRWWLKADEPFQCLATCIEIADAVRSGNPESFMSRLPVHQDGSCNGLQHYAALGRDEAGAAMVDLLPADLPQDVYSGVARRLRARLAENMGDDPLARMIVERNWIDRKLVKQTVMTSVYGVTPIGARMQILSRLRERDGFVDDAQGFRIARYLAEQTLKSIGDTFQGARDVMRWLAECGRIVAQSGRPVAWTTPMGLPIVQPYRASVRFQVKTILQKVTLTKSTLDLPVSLSKQRSAFPPNFIHSIDSTHMLMTAVECDRRGITFASVHDSFWTHACSVDEMNEAIRDNFISLHRLPLLLELKRDLQNQHPDLVFPDPPPAGSLDLERIKESLYFFD